MKAKQGRCELAFPARNLQVCGTVMSTTGALGGRHKTQLNAGIIPNISRVSEDEIGYGHHQEQRPRLNVVHRHICDPHT